MSDSNDTVSPDDSVSPESSMSDFDVAGVALEAIPPEEIAAIRSASASDARLRTELVAAGETAAELARVAPQREINRGRSAGMRSRLISRAAASREGRSGASRSTIEMLKAQRAKVPPQIPITPVAAATHTPAMGVRQPDRVAPRVVHVEHGKRGFNWLALVAGLALVATGVQLYRVTQERNTLSGAAGATDSALQEQVGALQTSLASKDSVIAALTGPNATIIDLSNYSSPDPLARMFWDRKTNQWTMYTYNLRQPKPGRTFQVWLVPNTNAPPISAGTFKPDETGAAVFHATQPMERGSLFKVLVSEEIEGGAPVRAGPIVIAGAR